MPTARARAPFTGLIVVVACGGKAPAPAPAEDRGPGPDDPGAIAARVFQAQGEMTAAAAANVGDCAAMARALTAVFDRVRPVFDRVDELRADPEAARALTTAFRGYDAQATAHADRMFHALTACRLDAAVADVMARMPVLQ